MKVLITGGAGFIGSRVSRMLLARGHEVTILDSFSPQIHGTNQDVPADLRGHVRLIRGDVRDRTLCAQAIAGQQALVHLAAETGTGQSMYQICHYTDVNISATAGLMELLTGGTHSIERLVVASSRAVYGEGSAHCQSHGLVYPFARSRQAMLDGRFEPKCPICGLDTVLIPTREDAPFRPSSLYGLTKQVQEQMTLMYARTLGINGFALRYQNVFGPGQSLKNPYTGILAIFSNLARANDHIQIFEDGKESRDFVYIDDVAEATVRCVEAGPQDPVAMNVGTGVPIAVETVAAEIIRFFSSSSELRITGAFREGDIRHNCADVSLMVSRLGFQPQIGFLSGLHKFLEWASREKLETGGYQESLKEMKERNLLHN